jgi:hypothetical protein
MGWERLLVIRTLQQQQQQPAWRSIILYIRSLTATCSSWSCLMEMFPLVA